MARSIWSGSISFGLVSVPVKLVTAVRDRAVHFNLLHGKDHSRVRQKLYCPAEDAEVPRDETVRGFAVSPDHYVVVSDEELESLQPEMTRNIDITDFVDIAQIDPLYFDRPYYLVPDEISAKAYKLLAETMRETGMAGVGRFVMRGKEYLVALRSCDGVLCLQTMHFADEVVGASEVGRPEADVAVTDKERALARQLVESMRSDFEPEKYHDTYREAVMKLVQAKAEGREIVAAPAAEEEPRRTVDLMAALEESLRLAREKQPA